MSSRKSITEIVKENKSVFVIIGVALILLELQIFLVAVLKSGRLSWIQILDHDGVMIYETKGKSLDSYSKTFFEQTYGPLSQYKTQLVTKEIPFPFRAWFVTAVGIPVGIILIYAFIVKAFIALFYGDASTQEKEKQADNPAKMELLIKRFSELNIFTIGFLILVGVFAFWVIPNFISYLTVVSMETIFRFKWFFLASILIVIGYIIWVTYLKYQLTKKSMENNFELEKTRMQLEYRATTDDSIPLQIDYQGQASAPSEKVNNPIKETPIDPL